MEYKIIIILLCLIPILVIFRSKIALLKKDTEVRKEVEEEAAEKRRTAIVNKKPVEVEDKTKNKEIDFLQRKLDYSIENEDLEKALDLLEELFKLLDSNDITLKHKQGIIHIKKGNYPAAEKIYKEITKESKTPMHFVNLGQCLFAQNKLEEALDAYLYALEMTHEYADNYLQTGYVLEKLGRLDEAKKMYYSALDIEKDKELANHLLRLEIAAGNTKAVEKLNELLS